MHAFYLDNGKFGILNHLLSFLLVMSGQVCIAMKFYEGSVGDRMAHLKGGKLPLSDVLR